MTPIRFTDIIGLASRQHYSYAYVPSSQLRNINMGKGLGKEKWTEK